MWTKKTADGNQPTKFLVQIPGVIKTFTVASSNMQAVAYALHQAFQTRNEFRWNGKVYNGENGLKALIADVANHPAFFDYVQALPGIPSQPVEMTLPMVDQSGTSVINSPVSGTPPTPVPVSPDIRTGASLSVDLDSVIQRCASGGLHRRDISKMMADIEDKYTLDATQLDTLHEALFKSLTD